MEYTYYCVWTEFLDGYVGEICLNMCPVYMIHRTLCIICVLKSPVYID